jgi:hypothetical protein
VNFRVRNNGVSRVRSYSSHPNGNGSTVAKERIAADSGKNEKANKSRPTNDDVALLNMASYDFLATLLD